MIFFFLLLNIICRYTFEPPRRGKNKKIKIKTRDVSEYSNVRIFAFHTNIRMRFLDLNIRIIF